MHTRTQTPIQIKHYMLTQKYACMRTRMHTSETRTARDEAACGPISSRNRAVVCAVAKDNCQGQLVWVSDSGQILQQMWGHLQVYFESLKSSSLIEGSLLKDIFSHIPEICAIHEKFLQEVSERIEKWHHMQKIGDILINTVCGSPVHLAPAAVFFLCEHVEPSAHYVSLSMTVLQVSANGTLQRLHSELHACQSCC